MYRRRRIARDKIAFSFDSFLDVVANVIGIIIKLILVTWVGARSYTTAMALLDSAPASVPSAQKPAPKITDDPLHGDVQRNLTELEEARTRLTAELRRLESLAKGTQDAQSELAALDRKRRDIDQHRQAIEALLTDEGKKAELAHMSLAELKKRGQDLLAQIKDVEKQPVAKQVLRYHTPVSRAVHGDELFFECKGGRITYIDLPAFLGEIQGGMDGVATELRTKATVVRLTSQVGAFRLRYVYEKEGEVGSSFRYGVSGWVVEPLVENRGETLKAALAAGSEFRRLTDGLDPNLTVVTFWVYPDSFDLFRRLRDHLYDREIEVAGRPLSEDGHIAASRSGTKSRGQ